MNEFDLRNFLYNNPLMEKKEDSKKGNKEEQKRAKGAIADDEKHIAKLVINIHLLCRVLITELVEIPYKTYMMYLLCISSILYAKVLACLK